MLERLPTYQHFSPQSLGFNWLEKIHLFNFTKERQEKLITARNKDWIDKIDNAIKQNKKVFIFVGLFHLDFKDGLLELLKKRDYKIEEMRRLVNVTFTILIAINLVGIACVDNLIVDAVLSLSNSVLFVGVVLYNTIKNYIKKDLW